MDVSIKAGSFTQVLLIEVYYTSYIRTVSNKLVITANFFMRISRQNCAESGSARNLACGPASYFVTIQLEDVGDAEDFRLLSVAASAPIGSGFLFPQNRRPIDK